MDDAVRQAMMKISSHCPKCGGLLHSERYYDQGQQCVGLHCVMCGTTYDPVVLDHRLHGPVKSTHRNIANMRRRNK